MNLKIPHCHNPEKYLGLFICSFNGKTNVGYTAEEVHALSQSDDVGNFDTFLIKRIDENKNWEIKGITDLDLLAYSAHAILTDSAEKAQEIYFHLLRKSENEPLPIPVEIALTRAYEFEPTHVVFLLFPYLQTQLLQNWLIHQPEIKQFELKTEDDVLEKFNNLSGVLLEQKPLTNRLDYNTRPIETLLEKINEPFQR